MVFIKHLSEETKRRMSKAHSGKHPSAETRMKMSRNHANFKGKNSPLFGKHLSEEHKQKIGVGHKGKCHSEETKCKISESRHRGQGWNWKGGMKATAARHRTLGFIPLNQEFVGSQGHHIDSEHVVFIPKELHRSWHSLDDFESMEKINTKVFCWLLGRG